MAATKVDYWYALAVVSGHERKVRQRILDRLKRAGLTTPDLEILCPDEEITIGRGTSDQKTVHRLTLPGYMLIRCRHLTPARIASIKGVSGVLSFLGGSDNPQPLRGREIENLLGQEHQSPRRREGGPLWKVGQNVVIIEGPLSEFTGTIGDIDSRQEHATVLVEIFGRQTPAQVDFRHLRAA